MNETTQTNKGTDPVNGRAEENNDMETGGAIVQNQSETSGILREETEAERIHNSQTATNEGDKPFGFRNFRINNEKREKTAYYASDYGKSTLDLYFSLTNEPITNPIEWDDMIRLEAGKGVENALVKVLKDSGYVDENYEQKSISIVREGVEIHGKIDAILKDGTPVEIKSINNKNVFDVRKYHDGFPRESYVGQLAIYMDALEVDYGYLFAVTLDGLEKFLILCQKIGEGKYRCGNVEVDIAKEYKRWAKIWNENIISKKLPDIWEYTYKPKIDSIDWTKVPLAKRRNAVMNGVVVGSDWQITYSPYCNKIVELQGEVRGYTDEEKKILADKLTTLFKK